MAAGRTELGRRVCYDNISVGNPINSKERTLPDVSLSVAGVLPPAKIVGGGEGSAGANAKGHSNLVNASDYPTANIPDDLAVAVVTLAGENVGIGG